MAVQDHPLYVKWLTAFHQRNEAERRYLEMGMNKHPEAEIEAAKIDLEKAQEEFAKVSVEIG
jgi:hypothetical protein